MSGWATQRKSSASRLAAADESPAAWGHPPFEVSWRARRKAPKTVHQGGEQHMLQPLELTRLALSDGAHDHLLRNMFNGDDFELGRRLQRQDPLP
jgi:hypothetical protein